MLFIKWKSLVILSFCILTELGLLTPVHAQDGTLDPVVIAVVDASMKDLSQKLGKLQTRDITPWHIDATGFPDSSLGCPAPGNTYDKKPVQAFQIRITAPDQSNPAKKFDYQYRATLDGSQLFECTPQGPGPNIAVVLPPPSTAIPADAASTGQVAAAPTANAPTPQAVPVIADGTRLNGWMRPDHVRWTADSSKIIGFQLASDESGSVADTPPQSPTPGNGLQLIDLVVNSIDQTLVLDEPPIRGAFSPNAKLMAVANADCSGSTFDVSTGQRLVQLLAPKVRTNAQEPSEIAWSPASAHIALLCGGNLIVWNASTGIQELLQPINVTGTGLMWSPDGNSLVTGFGPEVSNNQSPLVIDAQNGKVRFTLDAVSDGAFDGVIWGPNGRSIAVIDPPKGKDASTSIFQGDTGSRLRNLSNAFALQWSPDGKILAVLSRDKGVQLFDTSNANLIATLNGTDSSKRLLFVALAFSPDGKRIAAASDTNTILVWDVQTHAPLVQFEVRTTSLLYALKWKPDGTQLISFDLDGNLMLWTLPQS